jgi:hypothetical protein
MCLQKKTFGNLGENSVIIIINIRKKTAFYLQRRFPSVWSSFSMVKVEQLGILVSGVIDSLT